ncbi:DMT family transporter [Nocardiopsis dassonvillei]|uniref:Small multidrug resistance protein n=1 Tax=Nocardiopsis dassonvillei (strain ATCC 23218 / DSM 43111 / CIP 107115 / JCM 7437 / KCTC 9190 / NBRC 14626 / NCTC 10488 / NRRL B-5397 / IMRU 509) TaxID=446468 RepID=D7AVZ2_NOCDD|nr:SMR family transporter [Nocardiopsis dassonvillei]ADH69652.1 small multidrug resistance protein [Nocardiopsis dassonvillei subsp. dassonvillei DSM 43111]NKY78157.1 QacE family quaternary ammonium compound efflux SMR transporter [Nocardiopsis dassonvillei]VEI90165.1 Quaternary ammonium compound-resistance protein sugE [Nocardiopsis dassonvillei]
MLLAYALLAGTVALEVVGALATRYSDGFTRLMPTALTVASVLGAYYLFSLALLEGLDLGFAYAVWAAAGVIAVTLAGSLLLGDRLTRAQSAGIGLATLGVVLLQLGAA